MTINELNEKRSKLLTDAQKLSLAGFTTETRAQFDAMLADADVLEADIKRAERVEKFEAETRSAGRIPRAGFENAEQKSNDEVRSNLLHYMRTGEKRDLVTGTSGAPIVPTGFNGIMAEAAKSWGSLVINLKQWKTANGEPTRYALSSDIGQQFTAIAEAAPVSEADPSLSGKVSQVTKFTSGLVKVSSEMLSDAYFDIESWLRDEFAKRYFRGITAAVNAGTADGNVEAFASGITAANQIVSEAPAHISYNDIAALFGTLEYAYSNTASFVANSQTRAQIMTLTDNFGRPLFNPAQNGLPDMVLGLPMVVNQGQAAIAAGNLPLILASLKDYYVFRQAGEVQIVRLNERFRADSDQIGFVAFARVSGFTTVADATVSPAVALKIHA